MNVNHDTFFILFVRPSFSLCLEEREHVLPNLDYYTPGKMVTACCPAVHHHLFLSEVCLGYMVGSSSYCASLPLSFPLLSLFLLPSPPLSFFPLLYPCSYPCPASASVKKRCEECGGNKGDVICDRCDSVFCNACFQSVSTNFCPILSV